MVEFRKRIGGWLALGLLAVGALYAANATADDWNYPVGAAVATDGTIYVVDADWPGIRKVTAGKVEPFFQASKKFRTPLNKPRCVAVDPQGRVVAGDNSTRQVYRFDESGQPQPLVTSTAGIGMPMSLAFAENGDLLVADLELHRIWKVPAAGGEATKFVEITAPRGLFMDGKQRLWVVSHGKHPLVRVDAAGQIEPVVSERVFDFPHHVVVDEEGTAYVTDNYAKAVWKVAEGKKPEKLTSGPPLENPVGLARLGEDLLVVDPRAPDAKLFRLERGGKIAPLSP